MGNGSVPTKNWILLLPNQLTILRILLTPVFIVLLFSHGYLNKLIALAVFILASTTDAYDGYLARKYNAMSPQGKFLDPLADKILVLSAFFSFYYLGLYPLWMFVLILLRDVVITGLRTWMLARDTSLETSIFGKSKTVAQMVGIYVLLVFVLLTHWHLFAFMNETLHWMEINHVLWGLMFVVTLLTVGSGYHYLHVNWALLKKILRDPSQR